jgi:2-iminobutanoate/2-iminopropanoate deaminase
MSVIRLSKPTLASGAFHESNQEINMLVVRLRRFRWTPASRPAKLTHIGRPSLTETAMRQGPAGQPTKRFLKREAAQARAYSQAVISDGGRIVWLAGQVAGADAAGESLAGDFDGQVREVFARLGATLAEAGGRLSDIVTMTVFITDSRWGDRFTQLRKEIFRDDFPASALVTVAGLARPELLVEVQGIAVLG